MIMKIQHIKIHGVQLKCIRGKFIALSAYSRVESSKINYIGSGGQIFLPGCFSLLYSYCVEYCLQP